MGTLSSTILGLPIRRASISTNDPVVERHGREIDVHGGELVAGCCCCWLAHMMMVWPAQVHKPRRDMMDGERGGECSTNRQRKGMRTNDQCRGEK